MNISPRQLAQSNLPQSVTRALESSGLEPSCLCLELMETTLLRRPADTIEQLERLRALGVKIFIDDFGTGYSSLSYLYCLPIDLVKIDRSFIAQINPQNGKKKLAPAIINLAHNLGHPVIAEGLETSGQLQYLKQYKVD